MNPTKTDNLHWQITNTKNALCRLNFPCITTVYIQILETEGVQLHNQLHQSSTALGTSVYLYRLHTQPELHWNIEVFTWPFFCHVFLTCVCNDDITMPITVSSLDRTRDKTRIGWLHLIALHFFNMSGSWSRLQNTQRRLLARCRP